MDEGAQLEAKGALDKALAAYAKAKDWDNAIRLASSLNRHLEAAQLCQKAQKPFEAAVCFQRAGKLSECLEMLVQVPAASPRYRGACIQAVRVAVTMNKGLAAFSTFFMPFLSTKPQSRAEAGAMNQLGDALEAAGKGLLAKSVYRNVLAAFPDDAEAKMSAARLVSKPGASSPDAAASASGVRAAPQSASGSSPKLPVVSTASGVRAAPKPSAPAAAAAAKSKGPNLGELLLKRGSADVEVVAQLLWEKPSLAQSDTAFADALVKGGHVSDAEIVLALSEHARLPRLEEAQVVASATAEAARALTVEQAKRWNLVPLWFVEKQLTVAMRDPRDSLLVEQVRAASGASNVVGVFVTQRAIERGLARQYPQAAPPEPAAAPEVGSDWRGRDAFDPSTITEPPPPPPRPPMATPAPASKGTQKTHVMLVLPEVGSTFAGRYRIEELLGEGGSATVFKCTDLELGEAVAIKLFKPTSAADAENQVARFKLELSLSRQLAHPNIIRLYDLGLQDGWRYLTLELLEGADLMTVVERAGGPLPLELGLRYLVQVCDGLQAAHEKGVVHRDIKPQNIFITTQGQAKLMDFGLAKRMAARGVSTTGMVAGTPEYISPEQINGFSSVTHLTDLYALGATAYTVFTFAPPFHGLELMPMLMAQATQAPQPARERNKAIPPRLEAVMLKLLEKDPAKRVQSAAALGSELKRILEGL